MGLKLGRGSKKKMKGEEQEEYINLITVSFPCLMFEVLLESRLNWWHFKK
jgi:hypothetical protein